MNLPEKLDGVLQEEMGYEEWQLIRVIDLNKLQARIKELEETALIKDEAVQVVGMIEDGIPSRRKVIRIIMESLYSKLQKIIEKEK